VVLLVFGYTDFMKVSIIDIGTQSVKQYIFEVEGGDKTTVFYKRYSDAHLGNNDEITEEAIRRNLALLKECIERNQAAGVKKLELLGTDILRKARSATRFLAEVKKLTGCDIQVISQELEAEYLYEGFVPLLPDGFRFAAFNIGGGSTEVVFGDSDKMESYVNLPFGVKLLRSEFANGDAIDWCGVDAYLKRVIKAGSHCDNVFVTGALDFISTAGPPLGIVFERTPIPHHPVKITIGQYREYISVLRSTEISRLKELYPQDPGFCDNLALGQSVYLALAEALGAKTIIPSRNDLTDGVIRRMVQ
jgi:exopolyphosphatase/guanosine-5'-triphosphate,3'-diphosphate pyrophosphatase